MKVQDVKNDLTVKLGRVPTINEISEETGFTNEQIIQAMESSKAYGTYSLDGFANQNQDESDENPMDRYVGFEDSGYEKVELHEIFSNVLDKFSETYKYIFKQRFIENKSQAIIAKELGVSQMTISRAEKNIIAEFNKEIRK